MSKGKSIRWCFPFFTNTCTVQNKFATSTSSVILPSIKKPGSVVAAHSRQLLKKCSQTSSAIWDSTTPPVLYALLWLKHKLIYTLIMCTVYRAGVYLCDRTPPARCPECSGPRLPRAPGVRGCCRCRSDVERQHDARPLAATATARARAPARAPATTTQSEG